MRPSASILTLVLFFLPAWPAASEDADPEAEPSSWTPELVMEYRWVSSTAISADGTRVAYMVRHPEMEGEKAEFVERIRVAAADGASDVAYTRHDVSSTDPAFSPDGLYLAFLSERSEKTQVWTMRVAGGEAEPLTRSESGVESFRWSPDGRSVAFVAADPETEEEKKAKEEKREVVLVDRDFKYHHLYLVPAGEGAGEPEARKLTEGAFHVTDFDWAPDGKTIVFAHRNDPRINSDRIHGDLSIVRVEDGEVTPLVSWGGVDRDPVFSPDGRHVAFLSEGEEPRPVGFGDAYVVAVDGGEETLRALARTPDRDGDLLGWSGDGRELIVAEARGTTGQILAVPVDGAEARYLTDVPGVISDVSLTPDGGRAAFVYETSDRAPEVYVSALGSFQVTRRISTVHDGVPRPPMGRTELLTWTSADGLAIEGLLTYPVGYEKGGKVPLILQIHGGPAGVHQRDFTGSAAIYPIQVFAQEGYAVLRPNPRGSTGYGKDFRFANVRDWGHGDYEDLMSGVDMAIELGVADPDQLYVMGWSYGGYMTSYLVTRTDRFRAASMGAGLSNLVSMVHTTDVRDYLVAHMGKELWEDYEVYEKHSAIYRVKNVETPTQVIHGAEDLRVPLSQGQEFYHALDRLGVPTEMVVYPRTPHGPRQPKYMMDVARRILAWFEKHGG